MATVSECTVPDCARAVLARGACRMHYQRAAAGDESVRLAPVAPRVNSGKACSITGCGKPARNRTWCAMHYQRWRQHGDPLHEKEPPPPNCIRCGHPKIRNQSGKLYCKNCEAAGGRQWRSENAEAVRVASRAKYLRTRERHLARGRARYLANRPEHREQTRRWREAHPELVREYARRWAAKNPERCLANVEKRRARKLDAICEHGPGCVPWNVYLSIRGQICIYCGSGAEHADHYIPLSRGGLHCLNNIVPACARCNRRKGARLPDEWAHVLRQDTA